MLSGVGIETDPTKIEAIEFWPTQNTTKDVCRFLGFTGYYRRFMSGARRRGRQKNRLEDNVKVWTGVDFGDFLRAAEDREMCKGIVATSSVVPRRPSRLMG